MAVTLTPRGVRSQVVFFGTSGLPEDRYVNTFHWTRPDEIAIPQGDGDLGSWGDEAGRRLAEFYTVEAGDDNVSLAPFMNDAIKRDFEVRTYDLEQGDPREPWITQHSLPVAGSGTPLPYEVALVASFYAGRSIPRRRGRIYLGPFGQTALVKIGVHPGPAPGLLSCAAAAMQRLSEQGTMDRLSWAVYSPTDNEARVVTGGWVDNDFDTQRRRGARSTSRRVWPAE